MKLYTFNIDNYNPTPLELAHLTSLLTPKEQSTLSRIKIDKDRLLSLVGKILSRIALCDGLSSSGINVDISELRFGRTEAGKPILVDFVLPFIPHFNVSHSGYYLG
jgi:phosphopantetheinyl transferase